MTSLWRNGWRLVREVPGAPTLTIVLESQSLCMIERYVPGRGRELST